jgi:hypothetical protein
MTTIAYSSVNIQTSAQSVPSIPAWFGEITLMAHYRQSQRVLAAIEEQVRFARSGAGCFWCGHMGYARRADQCRIIAQMVSRSDRTGRGLCNT